MKLYLLDYGTGNVRSVINAIKQTGYELYYITQPSDFDKADKIIFPGVGAFGNAMKRLQELGLKDELIKYIKDNRPFMGICVGMQVLFNSSDESEEKGLGVINGYVKKFKKTKSVPHIGWNQTANVKKSDILQDDRFYFVHSFAVTVTDMELQDWCNVFATQFHPEKSGKAGIELIKKFIEAPLHEPASQSIPFKPPKDGLTKRIIACLDVRSNEQGDLVVTKGDQYDVKQDGNVRNLGKPVELAKRYFLEGADEVTFLNITSFRDCPLEDTPMLEVLKKTSESVFVPLTIGGGIRSIQQPDGSVVSALDVAGEYFRSGADKVSIGSDAVYIVEEYLKGDRSSNTISDISQKYGAQAVVISVDPKRVYVKQPNHHATIKPLKKGPNGEEYCWYQCTVKGGREARDIDVVQLATITELLGAGEILLNCMDHDGTNNGYDIELIKMVKNAVQIPVIASSGAGKPEHFNQVFKETGVEAALAAGIFHRNEVSIQQVKEHVAKEYPTRV
ncbi:Histidine biosynthesis bifunctional protein hisB [Boothiomyces sp. JEL0866]|nr:Histidine biosynthesis bifunctional protein hisB [Boothiomyces sp. JEL0866]